MQVFKQRDIMNAINEEINSDPLVKKIRLDANETVDFLEKVPDLYNRGCLLFNYKIDNTEYIYRDVIIETTKVDLLLG